MKKKLVDKKPSIKFPDAKKRLDNLATNRANQVSTPKPGKFKLTLTKHDISPTPIPDYPPKLPLVEEEEFEPTKRPRQQQQQVRIRQRPPEDNEVTTRRNNLRVPKRKKVKSVEQEEDKAYQVVSTSVYDPRRTKYYKRKQPKRYKSKHRTRVQKAFKSKYTARQNKLAEKEKKKKKQQQQQQQQDTRYTATQVVTGGYLQSRDEEEEDDNKKEQSKRFEFSVPGYQPPKAKDYDTVKRAYGYSGPPPPAKYPKPKPLVPATYAPKVNPVPKLFEPLPPKAVYLPEPPYAPEAVSYTPTTIKPSYPPPSPSYTPAKVSAFTAFPVRQGLPSLPPAAAPVLVETAKYKKPHRVTTLPPPPPPTPTPKPVKFKSFAPLVKAPKPAYPAVLAPAPAKLYDEADYDIYEENYKVSRTKKLLDKIDGPLYCIYPLSLSLSFSSQLSTGRTFLVLGR